MIKRTLILRASRRENLTVACSRSARETVWQYIEKERKNEKDTHQPVHPRSLIGAFVIRYLESKVVKLAPCKILVGLYG